MNPLVIKNLPLNFLNAEDREQICNNEFEENFANDTVVNTFKRTTSFETTSHFIMNWIDGFTEVSFN
ncbi:MAG: hypothetical protein QM539_04850 [Alphaproteobacteria bacterium]|nr:hypothetical protein [Alphaproteobacteria bacterium]